MKKIKIDVAEVLLQEFWENEAKLQDRKKWEEYDKIYDKFWETLSDEQKKLFTELDLMRQFLADDDEKLLLDFALNNLKGVIF